MTDLTMPEPVASFVDAVNNHDEAAFLGAFDDTGFVDDWGRIFTGRDEIKGWSDNEFIGADGTMSPQRVTVDGDVVTVIADWRSTHANGLSKFEFATAGDKLASMTIREG